MNANDMTHENERTGRLPKYPVSESAFDLAKRHGGIATTPEEALRELGVRKVYCETRAFYTLVAEKEYAELCSISHNLMREYPGYIFADHLDRMRRMINGHELLTRGELGFVKSRAEQFIAAKVPPIFNPDLYGYSYYTVYPLDSVEKGVTIMRLFPSVDFIIQFAIGMFELRRTAIAARLKSKGGFSPSALLIQPTTVSDVYRFRSRAFHKPKQINPFLIRETLSYVKEHFKFQDGDRASYVSERQWKIFLHLEEAMSRMPFVREYETWNGDTDVVLERCWYLRFKSADILKIIRARKDAMPFPPRDRDRQIWKQFNMLFPKICPDLQDIAARQRAEQILELEGRFERVESVDDLCGLPDWIFTKEPWRSRFMPKLVGLFESACEYLARESSESIFLATTEISERVHIPSVVLYRQPFKQVLSAVRLRTVREMDDRTFILVFCGESNRHRKASIACSRFYELDSSSRALRQYLRHRSQQLHSSLSASFD
ncbi:MAG: hypothetical protein PHW53_02255 [Patescibacteria group bacterium]|nr:hypothetical protein [Patescibacteria group bacterium]